jgi:hypothetical protein
MVVPVLGTGVMLKKTPGDFTLKSLVFCSLDIERGRRASFDTGHNCVLLPPLKKWWDGVHLDLS